eukprot:TRINITY_DN20416_c0_g2_i1.p1 TRINITY_DN20416_c0_g2~~TRINITY_DN20416_c0_g2_i1.p1  ORF type:complete len:181 (-),score=15.65 TRINITY_DN20416_c0_g2_i1:93-635(-)
MWARYLRLLDTHPVTTKSLSTAVVFVAGDFAQQAIEQSGTATKKWDVPRACRMGAFGGLFIGPVFHNWFRILDWAVPASLGATQATVAKVVIDQSCMAPAVMSSFFIFVGTLSGQSWQYTTEKLRRDFWPTLYTNWMVWPAAQAVNFYAVPINLRVLWLTGVQFCFNIYLSKQQHKDHVE